MKNRFFFIQFFIAFIGIGQTNVDTNYIEYYNKCIDAGILARSGNYQESIKLYESAISMVNHPYPNHYYLLGKAYGLSGNQKMMYHFLRKALLNGYWDYVSSDTLLFNRFKNQKKFQKFVKKQDYYMSLFNKTINPEEKKFVDSLVQIDESIRLEYFSLSQEEEPNQIKIDSLWQIDEKKNRCLLEYAKKYGFPSIRTTGNELAAAIILIHCVKLFPEYEAMLLNEVKKGNLPPYEFAAIHDRTYGPENCIYGIYFCNSFVSDAEILKNRRAIGVSPLVGDKIIK